MSCKQNDIWNENLYEQGLEGISGEEEYLALKSLSTERFDKEKVLVMLGMLSKTADFKELTLIKWIMNELDKI
jgi:hypothetical protein